MLHQFPSLHSSLQRIISLAKPIPGFQWKMLIVLRQVNGGIGGLWLSPVTKWPAGAMVILLLFQYFVVFVVEISFLLSHRNEDWYNPVNMVK